MSDVANESNGDGQGSGWSCPAMGSRIPPCHDIGMLYGIFIGV